MAGQNASLIRRLCEAGSPRGQELWEGRNGYYVAACRVSAEDVPELVDIARKWSDWDWPSDEDLPDIDADHAVLLPVTAWRTLADLEADAAVEPLVDMLRESDDVEDDWASDELPHVFGKIGEAAIPSLVQLAEDAHCKQFARSIATCALRYGAEYHPHTRDRVVAHLTQMMAGAVDDDVDFNSTLLVELVELRAVEAAEAIERAFAGNLLDVGMMGDWEIVRRKLGVEGLGLKMPENPHNSVQVFRKRMGIGIFSDQAIFRRDEIDHDREQEYLKCAWHAFSPSSEAQQVVDLFGQLEWFEMLLEFGLHYLGEIVDLMTLGSVQNFVLDYVPSKVSTEPDAAASIAHELARFWEYLDRVYKLPQAKSIVAWLTSDGLVRQLKAEMSDPSNFGMAKSIFMAGQKAGYDMSSAEERAKFMMVFNRALLPAQQTASPTDRNKAPETASPTNRKKRVGRNDPCPCGSGKKFKKCCR